MKHTDSTCSFCKATVKKNSATRHMERCAKFNEFIEKQQQKTVNEWLVIEAEAAPYWLHLLLPASYTLADLDTFLRDIWLECCDHLSAFRIDKQIYDCMLDGGDEFSSMHQVKNMEAKLSSVLSLGKKFSHEYDFGSTTYLNLQVKKVLKLPLKKETYLLFRNNPPDFPCSHCNQPATLICSFCQDTLCPSHTSKHSCVIKENEDYMVMPLVNSPRAGVCGYTGTA